MAPSTDLPEGVLVIRRGPGANCSSAGSAIDVLFYASALVGAVAVALAAALPPKDPPPAEPGAPKPDRLDKPPDNPS